MKQSLWVAAIVAALAIAAPVRAQTPDGSRSPDVRDPSPRGETQADRAAPPNNANTPQRPVSRSPDVGGTPPMKMPAGGSSTSR
jgi:hypothetical protein